jgi:ABC-2 type transport system ATP-binding protein
VSDQPIVAAEDVTKRYGAVTALDDVSVSVTSNATGLLGANGAGKSTLMKALLGLVRPDEGRLSVLGLDSAREAGRIRTELGYMPEGECLPQGMTARDAVVYLAELRGLPRRAAVLRASEVLFQVGLEEERSRLIRTFSTGMKQRTKLAQAIVHSPRLVVLDEPTNGLDPAGREEMLHLVRRLSRELGIAVLLSSHVLEDVERTCDAVVLLRAGRVARAGDIESLRGGASDRLEVRISGDAGAFAAALAARGFESAHREDRRFVLIATPGALDAVRDAAADAGAGLRELRPAGPTLEDALVEAME